MSRLDVTLPILKVQSCQGKYQAPRTGSLQRFIPWKYYTFLPNISILSYYSNNHKTYLKSLVEEITTVSRKVKHCFVLFLFIRTLHKTMSDTKCTQWLRNYNTVHTVYGKCFFLCVKVCRSELFCFLRTCKFKRKFSCTHSFLCLDSFTNRKIILMFMFWGLQIDRL